MRIKEYADSRSSQVSVIVRHRIRPVVSGSFLSVRIDGYGGVMIASGAECELMSRVN
jgi:hypothetical protein